MAQFLMLASDIAHAGRVSGDPVAVVEDAHIFSKNEDKREWLASGETSASWPGLFEIIKIPGVSKQVGDRILEQHIRPATVLDPEFSAPDESDRIVIIGPHRWQLGKQDRLPPPLANKLSKDGFLEVPFDIPTINDYVIDRQGVDVFITDTPIRM